jgi:two-component system NtrC family sensor kinase
MAKRKQVVRGRLAGNPATKRDPASLYVQLKKENEDLRRELTEALGRQTATTDVLKVISRSTFNLQTVLETLTTSAARLCDAEMASIARQDAQGFVHSTNYNYPADWVEFSQAFRTNPGRGSVSGRALLDGKAVQITDVLADPEYTYHEQQMKAGYRTFLAVPLLRDGQPIMLFNLARKTVRPFTDKQIDLVSTFADQAVIAIENVRLFDELRARTDDLSESLRQQTAITEILEVINSSPGNLVPVFDAMLEKATRLCEAAYGMLYRYDGIFFHAIALRGVPKVYADFLRGPIRPSPENALGRLLNGEPLIHMPDIRMDAAFDSGDPLRIATVELGRARTYLAVPLRKDGVLIGAIGAYRQEVRPFSERQVALLQNFAAQAVIASENVRLFEEIQARTSELSQSVDELRALGEVSQAVNSTVDLMVVLNTIVAKATQLSGTEAGAIYVFDQTVQEFHLRATYGMDDAIISEIKDRHIHIGETVVGKAVEQRIAIQIPDIHNDLNWPVLDVIVRAGFRALLIVPLLGGDRTVGALVVRRKKPGEFAQHTVDLLQTFAAQSVLAIQNARLFESVEARTRELAMSLEELRTAQDRLVQTQKLASLGQLTAGIAHEIKNPLNFINNFSALSAELVDELGNILKATALNKQIQEETSELTHMLKSNLEKVVQHGKRADSIVKNMLLHSREGSGERRSVELNALVEDSLNLSYHGARAENREFKIKLERSFDSTAGQVDLFPQEITRALLNLISNGFYAATKRKVETGLDGYEPTLTAVTRNLGDSVEIRIRDNGGGISPEVKEKMFNPFFTTKPPGEGTGLGLSLSYDIIVRQHAGLIEADTQPGEFTEFRVILPRRAARSKAGGNT